MNKRLIQGRPISAIFFFALPMLLGSLFQQVYNLVDSIIVGRFVGEAALAAVSAAFPLTFVILAFAIGTSVGSSILIAQLYGAEKTAELRRAISTNFITIIGIAVIVTTIGFLLTKTMLKWMNTSDDILPDAAIYIEVLFLGCLATFIYNAFAAILRAVGDSKTPLYFLMIAAVLNILLDLLFIVGLGAGVFGAAIATVISQSVACILCVWHIKKHIPLMDFKKDEIVFDRRMFTVMIKLSIPAAAQQLVVAFGVVLVQALINTYSLAAIAGYGAASKLDMIFTAPVLNFSMSLATFTAQNIGAGKIERVKEGYRATMLLMLISSVGIAGIVYMAGPLLMELFLDKDVSAEAISVGVSYIRAVAMTTFLFGFMLSANGVLRGAGDIAIVTVSTVVNLGARVYFAYALTGMLGIASTWWSIPIGWMFGTVIATSLYFSGRWKKKYLFKSAIQGEGQ